MDDFASCCLKILLVPLVSIVLIGLVAAWDYFGEEDSL